MSLKKLNSVNEVKDFVNRGKVVYYSVNGYDIESNINLSNDLLIYDSVRDVYCLLHYDNNAFDIVKGSDFITCDDIASMFERGIFVTPYDYLELHFHLETGVKSSCRMYYGTFEYYSYRIVNVYENGKDCGYSVIPILRYRNHTTSSYIHICEIYDKFIKTFDNLVYHISNVEEIKNQFSNDFNSIENGLSYGCVFRYDIK